MLLSENGTTQIARPILAKSDKPMKVIVEFHCLPSGQKLKIAQQPSEANKGLLKEVHEALSKMEKPPIKDGEVVFQIELTVSSETPANSGIN